MSKIRRKFFGVNNLGVELREEMFRLFDSYYDDVTFAQFEKDLQEKTHVMLFFEADRLIGFSTAFRKKIPEIGPGLFVFSGDTVLHRDYWGSRILHKSFFWFLVQTKLLSPLAPVNWMLMSKGVKTYLMMRKNVKKSWPNFHGPTPPEYQKKLNAFYAQKFGSAFDSQSGKIIFPKKAGAVKESENLSGSQSTTPEMEFFQKVNPGAKDGDELACIAEIRLSDILFGLFKFFV